MTERKERHMKKLVTIAAVLSMFGSVAFAGNTQIPSTVIGMEETYTTQLKNVPSQQCKTVEVPIYGERQTEGGNTVEGALAGAIIGGLIGEAVGGKNERNAGAIFGAIVGGDKAKGKTERVIVGYKQQQQCNTVYKNQVVQVRGQNKVTVELENGQVMEFMTNSWYRTGATLWLNVSL